MTGGCRSTTSVRLAAMSARSSASGTSCSPASGMGSKSGTRKGWAWNSLGVDLVAGEHGPADVDLDVFPEPPAAEPAGVFVAELERRYVVSSSARWRSRSAHCSSRWRRTAWILADRLPSGNSDPGVEIQVIAVSGPGELAELEAHVSVEVPLSSNVKRNMFVETPAGQR